MEAVEIVGPSLNRAAGTGPSVVVPLTGELATVAPRERATLAVLVTWIAIGLAVDTRRHRTDRSLDTFFTSAHALLYAGWVATAVFLLHVVRKRQAAGAVGRAAIPRGFEAAVAGAVLFGIGGIGDMIWHTVFGIEVELKILFSPTHLLLMTAMVMISFGPVRSTWLTRDAATARNLWPAALASGVITSVLLVFFQFVSAFDRPVFTVKVPGLFGLGEVLRVQAIAGIVILTVLFFTPILLMARRWELPFGMATLAFAVPALSNFIFTDFKTTRLSPAVVAGGLVTDLLWLALRSQRSSRPRLSYRLFGALAPFAFWCTYLGITMVGRTMQWPAELWTGTLLWSAIVGAGITVVLLPPVDAPATWLDPV
jgi:hypothetical protein